MYIIDIPEGLLQGFELVTAHLHLFYLVLISVELAQSDYLAGSHLKVAGI